MTDYTRRNLTYMTLQSNALPAALKELLDQPVDSQTPEWARLVIEQTFQLFGLAVEREGLTDSTSKAREGYLENWQQRALNRLRRLHREVEWEPRNETLRDKLRAILFAQLQTVLQKRSRNSSFQESA